MSLIDLGRLGFGLISGSAPPCVLDGLPIGTGSGAGERFAPYVSLASGARNGCASVLNTSGRVQASAKGVTRERTWVQCSDIYRG
jgi:hypothetical protein